MRVEQMPPGNDLLGCDHYGRGATDAAPDAHAPTDAATHPGPHAPADAPGHAHAAPADPSTVGPGRELGSGIGDARCFRLARYVATRKRGADPGSDRLDGRVDADPGAE
jgi:hypothetical protein